jgi:SAM-dependent methyltransferase
VGAGAGGIARWLANRVGPEGRVVATDIDLRFLDAEGFEVRRHNITADDLEEGAYDLVHARFLLCHLRDPAAVIARMARALRPGGWLLVEEPSAPPFAAVPHGPEAEAFDRMSRVVFDELPRRGGMAPTLGRRLPAFLTDTGLVEVGAEQTTPLRHGGREPCALALSIEVLADRLLASGLLSAEDLDAHVARHRAPAFYFYSAQMTSAWGRRV